VNVTSWAPLYALLGAYAAVVVALVAIGRRQRPPTGWAGWIPAGLERVTRIPGWAAAMAGTALFGLFTAGVGFYNDVAWHVALGRDKELFTAPHTMIVIGLGLIAIAAALGILFATVQRADVGLQIAGLRVPWSSIPLGLLGVSALTGFPLDELWHAQYGIDVTMWSPTHLLMIVGASLSPIAAWMALAEAGVRARDSRWGRAAHFIAAWLVLMGLSSVQGEFEFGVPQFQQLYHPVLVLIAAGAALTASRLVLGPGWTLLLATIPLVLRFDAVMGQGIDLTTRNAALYIGCAIAIEVGAWVAGTERRMRFALVSGAGVATFGLASEWWWNSGAHQPWTTNLLPDAVLVGALGALGAAAVGTALGGALRGDGRRIPTPILALAGVALLAALVVPFPRRSGDATAAVSLERTAANEAVVHVDVSPPEAAEGARWFQAISWQGGGLVLAEMKEQSPGTFRSERPVPISGKWKTLVRLHRGAEMISVPVWLPADPEIGEPEIPAEDRTLAFEGEQKYLMREAEPGSPWFAGVISTLLLALAAGWVAAFVLAAGRIGKTVSARSEQLERRVEVARTAERPLQLS